MSLALVVLLTWLGITYGLFTGRGLLVPTAGPALAVVLVTLVALVASLVTEGREKHELRAAFSRYVSGAVVERIMADPALAQLGGERRVAASGRDGRRHRC